MNPRLASAPIEPLEARVAPATVLTTMVGATLKITAISPAEAVDISLLQTGVGSFQLTDEGGLPVVFEAVRNISIVLSDQADSVAVALTQATGYRGSISINGLAGNDTISLLGNGNTAGDLTVTSAGAPVVLVDDGVSVRGAVKVTAAGGAFQLDGSAGAVTAAGLNTVTFAESSMVAAAARVTAPATGMQLNANGVAAGAFTFLGGAAADTVSLGGRFDGRLRLTLGDGANTVSAGADFNAGGAVNIVGGANGDEVTFDFTAANIFETSISGTVTIALGEGDNAVNFPGLGRIAGGLRVTGGTGADQVIINGNLQVGGLTQIMLGEGVNLARLENSFLHGGLRYTGGTNNDTLQFTNLDVLGAVRLTMGDGINSANLVVSDFDNGLSVKGGAGDDSVLFGGSRLRGTASLSLGDGTNDARLAGTQVRGTFSYKGGPGGDLVRVETSTIFGSLHVNALAGSNSFVADSLTGAAVFSYTGGADADAVSVSGADGFVRGRVRLGDGNDQAVLVTAAFVSFSFDGGAGSDTISRLAAAQAAGIIEVGFETINTL